MFFMVVFHGSQSGGAARLMYPPFLLYSHCAPAEGYFLQERRICDVPGLGRGT